ncbi:MAG: TraR/DksA family transcriptional regulator [Pseudomonadota bacterium]
MNTNTDPTRKRIVMALLQREAQLRATLQSETAAISQAGGAPGEVTDFKDLASSESLTAIDAIQGEHAATELGQVAAALRRLQDGTYGTCTDCGEPIDEKRLLALPAAPRCTACQAIAEQAKGH